MKRVYVSMYKMGENPDVEIGMIMNMITLVLNESVEIVSPDYSGAPEDADKSGIDLDVWCIGRQLEAIATADIVICNDWQFYDTYPIVRICLQHNIMVVDLEWLFDRVKNLYLKRDRYEEESDESREEEDV